MVETFLIQRRKHVKEAQFQTRGTQRGPQQDTVIKMAKIKDKHNLEGVKGGNSELHTAMS